MTSTTGAFRSVTALDVWFYPSDLFLWMSSHVTRHQVSSVHVEVCSWVSCIQDRLQTSQTCWSPVSMCSVWHVGDNEDLVLDLLSVFVQMTIVGWRRSLRRWLVNSLTSKGHLNEPWLVCIRVGPLHRGSWPTTSLRKKGLLEWCVNVYRQL